MKHKITRREFCCGAAAVLGAVSAGGVAACASSNGAAIQNIPAKAQPLAVVINKKMLSGSSIVGAEVRKTFESALPPAAAADSVNAAWDKILLQLKSKDVIGIKVNSISPELPSHPEVALAVAGSLKSYGIEPGRIIIWDRSNRELQRAGYKLNTGLDSVRIFGTDELGYDLDTPLFIKGQRVTLSSIVTKECRYLISLPVLKNHDRAGVTFSLKNWYGSVPLYDGMPFSSNFVMFMHTDGGSKRIAQLNSLEPLKTRVRLVVGDALLGAFTGGPGTPGQWIGSRLIVSLDPVAADAEALNIIEKLRKEKGLKSIASLAGFLAQAQAAGLGVINPPGDQRHEITV